MEFRPLEIKLLYAKDLRDVNLFTKMDVYAVVSINGDHQKTPVAKDCGSNPTWNYTMRFNVDETAALKNHHNLIVSLKSNRILGDREIGSVQVPIKELLDLNNGNGKVEHQHVSYSVRLHNGKAKGILNFTYKFGDKSTMPTFAPPPIQGAEKPVMAYPPPMTGYPGPSSGHPPPPPTQQGMTGYPYPPPGGYPPYGYNQGPAPGYGYQGYPPPPPHGGGYGYPPVQQPQKPKRSGMGAGAGLGLGLAGGLLGGMLIGDMVDDAYDAGMDYDF